jgi:hypothetical protein
MILVSDLSLLTNIQRPADEMEITAVSEQVLGTSVCRTLGGFGKVYYHPKAEVNLIPLGPLEKKFKIIYNQGESFEVIIPGEENVLFKRMDVDDEDYCFYVCDVEKMIKKNHRVNVATVEENTTSYSKGEVEVVKRAHELIRKKGYPSTRQVIDLIQSGFQFNGRVIAHDILLTETTFRRDIAVLKGKTVHMKHPAMKNEYISKPATENQILYADVLFVDRNLCNITASTPLML